MKICRQQETVFEIIDVFVKGGYEVIVHPTQAVGDGFEKTKELAPQVDLVVCSGGDGTLDEVVSGQDARH